MPPTSTKSSRPIIIAPSILSADFSILGQEITAVENAGADWIHMDVMDGHFVPNITFGPPIIQSLRPVSNLIYDVHLMIENPDQYVESFANAGADIITVHVEACTHLDRTLQLIRNMGKKAGVSLNPATPVETIQHVLDRVDLILLMSVNPGFGGQSFIHYVVDKMRAVKQMVGERDIDIEVDGGVTPETAPLVCAAGVNVLVAGSAIYKGNREDQYRENITAIRQSVAEIV